MPTLPGDQRYNGVSWREYVDAQLVALRDAVRVAYTAMEKRLDIMNEFRESLRDMVARLATKIEVELLRDQVGRLATKIEVELLAHRVIELEKWRSNQEGKASQGSVNLALSIAMLGLLLSVIGLLVSVMR